MSVAPKRGARCTSRTSTCASPVLPDLGGHLYSCVDKISGREMFYANPSIKKALIGYRGAWAAFGIEFNFPVSHNWMSMSPVDFATTTADDGSASIWVGNTDRVYGTAWRVQLTLQPGRAVLDQAVTLENPSDVRHRFYWWTNAAVEVGDDSRLIYPVRFMASHGFTRVDPWPVDAKGRDLSVISNQTGGPVSMFTYGSREPFMGVYHPRTDTGVAHVASTADLPTDKVWSWGVDADGLSWRDALSDNRSAYIELQAGLFRNQETYAFLQPQESIHFTEHWVPMRGIGTFTRATTDAVLRVGRTPGRALDIGLNVTRALRAARLRISTIEPRLVAEQTIDLEPAVSFTRSYAELTSADPYIVELIDGTGAVLLRHTETQYDGVPGTEVTVGPQKTFRIPPSDRGSEAEVAALGEEQELDGKLLSAADTYRTGLARFPDSFLLNRAAGRLAVTLKRYRDAVPLLRKALSRPSNDAETQSYLGLAYDVRGRGRLCARPMGASAWIRTAPPRLLPAARATVGAGRRTCPPLSATWTICYESRPMMCARAGCRWHWSDWRVIPVVRATGHRPGPRSIRRTRLCVCSVLHSALTIPCSGGISGPSRSASSTPQRNTYGLVRSPRRSTCWIAIIRWRPHSSANRERWPLGSRARVVLPGRTAASGWAARGHRTISAGAGSRPTTCSPIVRSRSRCCGRRWLHTAGDATARFLLGSLSLLGGMVEDAVYEWERVRQTGARFKTLHRNLGYAWLFGLHRPERAEPVLAEGLVANPENRDLYEGLDAVLSLLGRPAATEWRCCGDTPHCPPLRRRLSRSSRSR